MEEIALKSGYYFLSIEKDKIPFLDKLTKTKNKVKFQEKELDIYDAFDIETSKEVDDFFGNNMGYYIDDYLIEEEIENKDYEF